MGCSSSVLCLAMLLAAARHRVSMLPVLCILLHVGCVSASLWAVLRSRAVLFCTMQVRVEIESLAEGVDLSEPLTRARFEELNNDLFKKTLGPVRKVCVPAHAGFPCSSNSSRCCCGPQSTVETPAAQLALQKNVSHVCCCNSGACQVAANHLTRCWHQPFPALSAAMLPLLLQ